MKIGDLSQWNDPATTPYDAFDGFIIQTSHGVVEEPKWREHFNNVVAHKKKFGFYHFAEHNPPDQESALFHNLTGGGWVNPELGWWLDSETGQTFGWVDGFRSSVRLPYCGVYSNGDGFNNKMEGRYNHFGMNWLADPNFAAINPMPDYILVQYGEEQGVDASLWYPGQPLPPAWR